MLQSRTYNHCAPFTDDDKGRPECGVCVVCGPGVDHEIIQFGGVIAIPMLAGSMLLMFGAAFAVFFGCLGNRVLLLFFSEEKIKRGFEKFLCSSNNKQIGNRLAVAVGGAQF